LREQGFSLREQCSSVRELGTSVGEIKASVRGGCEAGHSVRENKQTIKAKLKLMDQGGGFEGKLVIGAEVEVDSSQEQGWKHSNTS
jgi:hypothetical protein